MNKKKYFIQFKRFGQTTTTPLKTKHNALMCYFMKFEMYEALRDVKELKFFKQLKNGKIIDLTVSVNKFAGLK